MVGVPSPPLQLGRVRVQTIASGIFAGTEMTAYPRRLIPTDSSRGPATSTGRLAEQLVTLAVLHGFPEYVNPLTGDPHCAQGFSWTAALALDLVTRNALSL